MARGSAGTRKCTPAPRPASEGSECCRPPRPAAGRPRGRTIDRRGSVDPRARMRRRARNRRRAEHGRDRHGDLGNLQKRGPAWNKVSRSVGDSGTDRSSPLRSTTWASWRHNRASTRQLVRCSTKAWRHSARSTTNTGSPWRSSTMVTCRVEWATTRRRDPLLEESLTLARNLGDKALIPVALNTLGELVCRQGDHEVARALNDEGLAISRPGRRQTSGRGHAAVPRRRGRALRGVRGGAIHFQTDTLAAARIGLQAEDRCRAQLPGAGSRAVRRLCRSETTSRREPGDVPANGNAARHRRFAARPGGHRALRRRSGTCTGPLSNRASPCHWT